MDYKSPDFNPNNLLDNESSLEPIPERHSLPPLSNINPNTVDQIDKIVDDEIISIKDGGTCKYLVRWKEKPPTNDLWIYQSELQKINLDILEQYESSFSSNLTESSSFQPEENDADIMKPKRNSKPNSKGRKVYQRRPKNTMTI